MLLFGSDEQKKRYLPDIAAGKRLVAFALTEANAGSDAAGIQTTARRDGRGICIKRYEAVDYQWRRSRGLYGYRHYGQVKGAERSVAPLLLKKIRPVFISARRRKKWA